MATESTEKQDLSYIRPAVLDFDDVAKAVPKLKGHRKLVERVFRWLSIDKVNKLHTDNYHTPGIPFTDGLLHDLDITLRVDGEENLSLFPEGAFITVSNHPFGALDGISLINLVGHHRNDFKVMVNMILNQITAMRQNFIAVDALASSDPKKKAVSMQGIKQAIMHVRRGHPIGFFPAGAVSKMNLRGHLEDRQWQTSIIRLIMQLGVPVIPIYFHGRNSRWFNFLGLISWKLRTMRLPAEVFRRKHSTIHISVGSPLMPDEIKAHSESVEMLGEFLKKTTYSLSSCK
ncbi:MAG: lysophospholipid acyltransferase family protein [Paramuribaculum sp.]|nr:lysophospholipid acyltransferase family protein [Paramuribaculum sp.]